MVWEPEVLVTAVGHDSRQAFKATLTGVILVYI
jgi:hypothetical protein